MIDVAAALAASPWAGRGGLDWRAGVASVASPMCQAVDWANFVVSDAAGDTLFLKILQPDMHGFVAFEAAQAGAEAAMQAGVGPDVAFSLPARGAIGFSYMPPPWRGARLDDLGRPDVMQRVIAAKQAFRRGAAALSRDWDVFGRVCDHAALARRAGIALPSDMPALLASIKEIGAALDAAGREMAPCHNDGQASNILLADDGRVLLVDFDCAGQADPHYDLGILMNEAYMFEDDWRQAIEIQDGRCDERVLNRCRCYAVADDLMWGLWGLILAATSPRKELEFLKYGEWRLLRCRMALREPDFAARLHRL